MGSQDKQAEIEFFDRFDRAGGYDRFDAHGYTKLLEYFRMAVDPQPGETIIDMGCGSGSFTCQLAAAFPKCHVQGMDVAPGCIARAKKDYPHIAFSVGDVESSGRTGDCVDAVCFSALLHHFLDFEKVAQEAYRILKPGGRFFSFDPHYYNPAFWLYRCRRSPFYSGIGVTKNERLLTAQEVGRTFSKTGFKTEIRIVSGISFQYVESDQAKKILWLYNFLDRKLAATPLEKWIGAWVLGYGRKPDR